MRDDMHEVIIERPRWGSRMRHARRFARGDPKRATSHDPESLPLRKSMGRAAAENRRRKEFSDLLGPLKRYLAGQVNRPWNKVWSEIAAKSNTANKAQWHLRGHMFDLVAINTSIRDGVVWVIERRGRRPIQLPECGRQFYVDPRTGILRVNKHYRTFSRRLREMEAADKRYRETRVRVLGRLVEAHRLDDKWWWEIRLAAKPIERRGIVGTDGTPEEGVVMRPYVDVLLGSGLTRLSARQLYGRDDLYAVGKRQLSRAEIDALGLTR